MVAAVLALTFALLSCGPDAPPETDPAGVAAPGQQGEPQPSLPSAPVASAASPGYSLAEAGEHLEVVAEGFGYLEGPAADEGGGLLFSDVPAEEIRHLDPTNARHEVRFADTDGANGLAVDYDGSVIAAVGDDRQVVRFRQGQRPLVLLAVGAGGSPLLGPNDVALGRDGRLYFSDPGPRPDQPTDQDAAAGVYLRSTNGVVSKLAVGAVRPNGLLLSRDERTLYVSDTFDSTVRAVQLNSDGGVASVGTFSTLVGVPKVSNADGMCLDELGEVYVATTTGLQVFGADGGYLATIEVPQQPSNCAFAGLDRRDLYITARSALYRVRLTTAGVARRSK